MQLNRMFFSVIFCIVPLFQSFLTAQVSTNGRNTLTSNEDTVYLSDVQFDSKSFSLAKGLNGHRAVYRKAEAPSAAYILVPFDHLGEGVYQFSTEASMIDTSCDNSKGTYWMQWQWKREDKVQFIIFDSFRGARQYIGKFEFKGSDKTLKIWLPEGVGLISISYKKVSPKVPEGLKHYTPSVIPPKAHPRLWATPSFLPVLKKRLESPESQWAWKKVQEVAHSEYAFKAVDTIGVFYSDSLEKIIKAKAFYYLVTKDNSVGGDAIRLLLAYYKRLEFGNVAYGDISRQIGRAIYVGSLVYDWCNALIGRENKTVLRDKMTVLARKLEVGWPPFKYPVVNGHADEAMISRDLLSMSIAIYNENPLPYKYVSYALLEQLAPMMQFEYQSSKHNQGVDYGAYRFGWEMHGAMLFYRMMKRKIYPDNLKNLPYYWLYMRLPNGYMFRDGDMFRNRSKQPGKYYWTQPRTMLLCYAYFRDPLMKGEFAREGGLPDEPVLYLLLNDPKIETVRSPAQLPLTRDFGKVLGGMLARTGWDNRRESNDAIAEIRGGGYLFGNHEHADAGAIQLYYHGMQFGDIGLYLAYGTTYDYNFNKRSVAHSMVLAYDPKEKLYFGAKIRDGGARFNQRFPVSPRQAKTDPWFNAGSVLSTDFGPDLKEPEYSYYKAELAPAYSAKVSHYTRSFCFFNLDNSDVPAALVVVDDITTAKPGVKKYWQINAYKQPEVLNSSILLHNQTAGITGYTKVNMVFPEPKNRRVRVLSKDSSRFVFGTYLDIKHNYMPESGASRILISPIEPSRKQRFVTVFQMMEDTTKSLPVFFKEKKTYNEVRFGNVVYLFGVDKKEATDSIEIQFDKSSTAYTLLATGLDPGFWHVRKRGTKKSMNYYVYPGKNTLYMKVNKGTYILVQGRDYNGKYYNAPTGKTFYLDYKLVPAH